LAENDKTVSDKVATGAGNVFTGTVRKATAGLKGFAGGLLDTNPQLSDLTSGLGALNSVVKYLEGGLGTLQGFSRFGVDFGMSIGKMNESAAGARLKLDEMASLISSNTDFLLTFGDGLVGVSDGASRFLDMQRKFFFTLEGQSTETSLQLQRLGLTTKDINESFLQYDAIENYRRKGQQQTEEERNASAMEFTKNLDKLSKLTGKQTQQLQKEIEAKMRQGDVAAYLTELDTKSRKSFLEGSQLFKTMGPAMQQLFEDMVIRKFPGKDVAPLVAMMPKTVKAFEEYERVLKNGTDAEREAALAAALSTAAAEQQSTTMRELAKLGGRVDSNITELYSRVFGEGAFGLAEAIRQVQDQFKAEGKNVDLAGAEFLDRVKKKQEEIMKGPKTIDPKTGKEVEDEGRSAVEALLKLQGIASGMALEAQKQISGLYSTLGKSADDFANYLRTQLNVKNEVDNILSTVRSTLGIGGSDMAAVVANSSAAVRNAIQANNPELAAEINKLVTQIKESPESERTKLIEDLASKIKEAMSLTWENVNVNATGTVVVNGPVNERSIPPDRRGTQNDPGRETGSLGKTGRLFENFGKQSNMLLHGIESVQTPEQTASIMRNSALGALQAVSDIFNVGTLSNDVASNVTPIMETLAANNVQTLNGMLNTMQNTSRQMVSNASAKGMDMSELTQSFRSAMSEIKKPIEDVASSIKGPMEQLAQTAGQQLEIQQKQLKGIRGMSGDVMRGLG
jgi:hypothetical protein